MLIAIAVTARYHQTGNKSCERATYQRHAATPCKMKRTKTGRMRDEFKAFGQIDINPDFSLGMTSRQEDLLHQMMTKQEESNPEQVKKAENVLSWIQKNYNVADVVEKDGTHHGELYSAPIKSGKGKSSVKETVIIHKNKFQAAAKKLNTVQNLANVKVTPKPAPELPKPATELPKPKEVPQQKELPKQKEVPQPKEVPQQKEIANPKESSKPNPPTLRNKPQTTHEPDLSEIEIMNQLKSLCIMESPWKSYHQGKELGAGAVGLVTLAVHKTTKEKVAMKQIDLVESEDLMGSGVNKNPFKIKFDNRRKFTKKVTFETQNVDNSIKLGQLTSWHSAFYTSFKVLCVVTNFLPQPANLICMDISVMLIQCP